MKKILVAGSSNMDFVFRVAEMPRKGETILSKNFNRIPGGKGANQAFACGNLDGDCTFLSVVGRDGLGDMLMESLLHANVDVSPVLFADDVPTGMAAISVNDDGENSIILVPGANLLCGTAYFAAHQECIAAADIILTQLETPQDDVYRLIKEVKQAGKLIILNPAPAPDSVPDEVLSSVDYLTPNETELEHLTQMPTRTVDEIAAAAKMLVRQGVRNVIVTIGPRGVLLCNDQNCAVYPTYDTKRVDTTAAGDTFNAGLAVGLAEGKPLCEVLDFANAAAALSITIKGAQTSIPKRSEVELLMRTAPHLTE